MSPLLKFGGVAVVVAACVGYLAWTATGSTAEYYQTISEVKSHPQAGDVRVLGTVEDGYQKDGGTVSFTASDGSDHLDVVYTGTLPDIFKAGIQVVVEGRQGADGVFHARTLLAKCPSRFTAQTPASS